MSVQGNTNLESSPVAISQVITGSSQPSESSALKHDNGVSAAAAATDIPSNGKPYSSSDSSNIQSTQEEDMDNVYQLIHPSKPQLETPPLSNMAHKRTYSDMPSKSQVDATIVASSGHRRVASEHEIDTAAPIESVKEAVSKFGGIVDWKAHRAQTDEKCKHVEDELNKAKEETDNYKKQAQAAIDAKNSAQNELDGTKRLVEELKLNLERAQTEEQQAKQDSELAKLRVEEVQQGIADDASVATNTQFEVAQARHAAAVTELKNVKEELEKLRNEYSSLVVEKDTAVKKADEAVSASTEAEKMVEALTLELLEAKGSLESAHTAHLEAEEQKIREEMAKNQDSSNWEKELKEAEAELQSLNQQYLSEKELKLKLDEATTLLSNLKSEVQFYKDSQTHQKYNDGEENHEEVSSSERELEEVRLKLEKAIEEVNNLKVASETLKPEIENEKSALSTTKEKEETAALTVASLKAQLHSIMSELESIHMEKGKKEDSDEVQNQLNQVTKEKEKSKSLAVSAHEEMSKEKDVVELAKAGALTIERKIHAAQKEMEASRQAESFALAAVKAFEESELVGNEDASKGVTLSIEEYQQLSKKATELEEQAKHKVAAAISQMEEAKESEMRSLERLEQVNKEKDSKEEELRIATERAQKAKEEKLEIEHELRSWRAANEERRRPSDLAQRVSDAIDSPKITDQTKCLERSSTAPVQTDSEDVCLNATEDDSSIEADGSRKKKKKRSLFPRIVMFLARRKVAAPKVA